VHEVALKQFFEGSAPATELARDLQSAMQSTVCGSIRQPIVDMEGEFAVRSEHLVRICDAVLEGLIPPASLQAAGFCLVASDAFHLDTDSLDRELVARVVHEWSAPEINYPLTVRNVSEWRRMLCGEEARLETS